MSQAEVIPLHTEQQLAVHVTKEQLRAQLEPLRGHTYETPEGKAALKTCVSLRNRIDEKRLAMGEEARAHIAKVNSVASELQVMVAEVESPLAAAKKVEVDAKKAAEAAAEKARLEAVAAREREEREAREAELRKQEEANRAERDRLAAEQRKLDETRAAQEAAQRAEREAFEAEKRALAEERAKLEREEFGRQAAIKAEAEAKAQAERDRIAAEEARVAEAEREAARKARLEALKPDLLKLREFALVLRRLERPSLASTEAVAAMNDTMAFVRRGIEVLEDFGAEQAAAE